MNNINTLNLSSIIGISDNTMSTTPNTYPGHTYTYTGTGITMTQPFDNTIIYQFLEKMFEFKELIK